MFGLACNCKRTTLTIKVNADYGADPIWCGICNYNLNLDELSISAEFKKEFFDWVNEYGRWIDFENESLLANAKEIEQIHNIRGEQLTEKLKLELSNDYNIKFEPSNMVNSYNVFIFE